MRADGAMGIGVVAVGAWWMPKVAASIARIAAMIDLSMKAVATNLVAVLYSID